MEEKIIAIMERVFNSKGLNTNTNQQNCGNWDSLRHLNLIIELENEFDVEFEPEEIADMKSLIDIERQLKKKL